MDTEVAVLCYLSVIAAEFFDFRIARLVDRWQTETQPDIRHALQLIMLSTALSALAISSFVFNFAILQEGTGHFPPLFFLLAAALFAAMNNHQILAALVIREIIYGTAFVAVALIDVVRFAPPLNDQIWLNFFTVIFVMYFIIDISRVFLAMYRRNLRHLRQIESEHSKTLEAYQVKSRFVSTVSHELRTPLTSIKGSIDLINTGALGDVPEGYAKLLDIAGRNSERLERLINDVLDVQRMESDRGFSDFVPVDVATLLQESVDANSGFAEKHNVRLELIDTVTNAKIFGDERRLIQVLTNLISNAVKFSGDRKLVEVWSERCGEGVKICVRDHGIGIPDGAHDKVFGYFTQIDSSDQRRSGGSGLGMSISKQIIDRHHGEIDYVSELGKGSTFFIVLKEYNPGLQPLVEPDETSPETGRNALAAE
ncbi:sensor histidine kinase [Marimonas arenosa]|uniref:histidine kinase n=1 Tax=Marimonas arenosa TaxID=1795305 RepID=A0AAE3WBS6_9RHOB|nr:ATP-binding protein [Marimonas arenosa]MDQ2088795.1 HAMP domain-containing histidine kinase [Marimonas arenosa]